jgi:CHAD domain-containing protein
MSRRAATHANLPVLPGTGLPSRRLVAVARECCQQALHATTDRTDEEAVHTARRAFKRARAVLRLLEDANLAGAAARKNQLAACMRQLSRQRDAVVVAQLAADLAKQVKKRPQMVLLELADTHSPARSAVWWKKWRRSVEIATRQLDRLKLAQVDAKALSRSLQHLVRRACRRVGKGCDGIQAHEWRKSVVIVRELLSLGLVAGVPSLDEQHARLQKVTRQLGHAVDCEVLLSVLRKKQWPDVLKPAAENVAFLVRKRQKRAVKKARSLWPKVEKRLKRATSTK